MSSRSDRFIPSRNSIDADLSHYQITENCVPSNLPTSPSKEQYKCTLADSILGKQPQSSRILSFRSKPPSAKEGMENPAKVLYSSQRKQSVSQSSRAVPQSAERILDAPDLLDDYYLNLLDWSRENVLAVALGSVVYLFNAATGAIDELVSLPEGDYVSSVSWIREGTHLAVGTQSGVAQLWDVNQGKQLRQMTGHVARVSSMDWKGHVLSTGSRDTTIRNHDVRLREHEISSFEGHTQEVCSLSWCGDQLASGGNDNLLNIWDVSQGMPQGVVTQPKHQLSLHNAAVKALAWCPWQANTLASGGGTADRTIKFWNTSTGACLNSVDTGSQVCALEWSRHYKELVSSHGYSQNQLIVWKFPSMNKVAELHGHTERVLHMATSPDGQTVVSASADQTLRFWKLFETNKMENKSKRSAGSSRSSSSRLAMRTVR